MFDYILNFKFNSWIGIYLYWVPLGVCVFGYTARTAKNYVKDKAQREKKGASYYPTDTIGSLIGRALVSIIPVANLWAGMFDLAPKIIGNVCEWLDSTFNIPLVPDSEAAKQARQAK